MGWDERLFVGSDDSLEELRCPICTLVAEDAVFAPSRCQDAFCEACIQQWLKQGKGSGACPLCRTPLFAHDLQPHRLLRRLVTSLPVQCTTTGCNWTGILSDWCAHQKQCTHKVSISSSSDVNGNASKQYELREETTVACALGVAETLEQRRRRKKKKKSNSRRHRKHADEDAATDDEEAFWRAAISEATQERRLQLAGSGPIVQSLGESPVEIEGIGARVCVCLKLVEHVRFALASRNWRHAAKVCGLSFTDRGRIVLTLNLGFGFLLNGVHLQDEDSPTIKCAGISPMEAGLMELAQTAPCRWARWFAMLGHLSALLSGYTKRIHAVSIRGPDFSEVQGLGRSMPRILTEIDPIELPISYLQKPFPETDLGINCAIGVELFDADGERYQARPIDPDASGNADFCDEWSLTPRHPLRNPKYDDAFGEVVEIEGRDSLQRCFSGMFEIEASGPQCLHSEWTLHTPEGTVVLRAGEMAEGSLQWWVRGHQKVGQFYCALDVQRLGCKMKFKILECYE